MNISDIVFFWKGKLDLFLSDCYVEGGKRSTKFPSCQLKSMFSFYEEEMARAFISKDAERQLEEEGKQFFDQVIAENFFEKIKQLKKQFIDEVEFIKELQLEKINNKELAKIFEEFSEIIISAWPFYNQSEEGPLLYLEKRIKEILEERYENTEEKFLLLCEPTEFDAIAQGNIDWLTLVSENHELTKEDFLSYTEKYPWTIWNTYDVDAAYATSKGRFTSMDDDHWYEIQLFKKRKAKHKQAVEVVLNEVGSDELRYLTSVFHRTAMHRMTIKYIWAGADFFARDLFSEVARRLDITREQLSKGYRVKEIISALTRGKKLSDKELENRRTFFFGYTEKEDIFLTGLQAKEFAKKHFPIFTEDKEVKELKGRPASSGRAYGRVKILLSSDLADIAEMEKRFEKGDILVADMTQPAAMLLIRKAGAIVTDEGSLTSHAAIVSRELGIPCIVGTHSATEVLEDGDLIEVDANDGLVRKIDL